VLRELELTWALTERAAKLLQVEPSQVEPLQVIHYAPGQFYKPHHDHAGYYLSETPPSGGGEGSLEDEADAPQLPQPTGEPTGESRPATILVFLSDVEGGGELNFPRLGLSFTPAKGDAVAWSNVNVKGLADPTMVHEGRPPTSGVKVRSTTRSPRARARAHEGGREKTWGLPHAFGFPRCLPLLAAGGGEHLDPGQAFHRHPGA
jgi:hypothetical protein